MGENSQVKKASKATSAAGKTVEQGISNYQNDPLFSQIHGIIQNVLANPLTMTPQAQDAMYQQGVSQANQAANSFLNDRMTQLAASGAGYRSGSARDAEFEAGARLGEGLANAYRQTQLAMAQQRIPDLLNAANAGQGFLNNLFGQQQTLANTRLGQASQFSTLGQIPSPLAQTLGGVGQIGGNILTAGTTSKGVFK